MENDRQWMRLQDMVPGPWYRVWDGAQVVRCRLLRDSPIEDYAFERALKWDKDDVDDDGVVDDDDSEEEEDDDDEEKKGAVADADDEIDEFKIDPATFVGFSASDEVYKLRVWYRWPLPPPLSLSEYRCVKKHDLATLLPFLFESQKSRRFAARNYTLKLRRLGVLDFEGLELVEDIRPSGQLREYATTAKTARRPGRECFTWRQFVREALQAGVGIEAQMTVTLEREEERDRCESPQCVEFLKRQVQLIVESIGDYKSQGQLDGFEVWHTEPYAIRALRRMLQTLCDRSRVRQPKIRTFRYHNMKSTKVRSKRPRALNYGLTGLGELKTDRERLFVVAAAAAGAAAAAAAANGSSTSLMTGDGRETRPGVVSTYRATDLRHRRRFARRSRRRRCTATLEFDTRGQLLLDGTVYLPSAKRRRRRNRRRATARTQSDDGDSEGERSDTTDSKSSGLYDEMVQHELLSLSR